MGRLTNPEPWRKSLSGDLFAAIEGWITVQSFDVTHRRWLAATTSDSLVAVIHKRLERGGTRGAILKILSADLSAAELRGAAIARPATPTAFYARHLIPTASTSELAETGWRLHLQEVAQIDVASLLPLSVVVDDPAFSDYCGTITSSLVRDWNPATTRSETTAHDPAAFLADVLAAHWTGLKEFAQEQGMSDGPYAAEIQVPGRSQALPNPLALLAGTLATEAIDVFRGNTHGNLRLDNVLVPVDKNGVNAPEYRLVDIDQFSTNGPISGDPMKLLLSVASYWLPSLAAASAIRSSLAELAVQPTVVSKAAPTAGYHAVASRIHDGAALWATPRRCVAPKRWRSRAPSQLTSRSDDSYPETWRSC